VNGRPDVLVAPTTMSECEVGACRRCRGRRLLGRILHVCLCRCHLGDREGPAPAPADPLQPSQAVSSRIEPALGHSCPRCGWPKRAQTPEEAYAAALAASVFAEKAGGDTTASARAARKTARRTAAGLCIDCGKMAPAPLCIRCIGCLEARRARRRKNTGMKPWRPGGPGRPPISQQRMEAP